MLTLNCVQQNQLRDMIQDTKDVLSFIVTCSKIQWKAIQSVAKLHDYSQAVHSVLVQAKENNVKVKSD